MITIELQYNQFRMKFSAPGTGWRSYYAIAADSEEIKLAIDHHLGTGHISGGLDSCPLCRMIRRDAESEVKRHARMRKVKP